MAKPLASYLADHLSVECIDTKCQKAMRVRPYSSTHDIGGLGIEFQPGESQELDFQRACVLFEHSHFISYSFNRNRQRFVESEMRIYQIQIPKAGGGLRILGTIITDGEQNLVRYCVEDTQTSSRALMRDSLALLCTAQSLRDYRRD